MERQNASVVSLHSLQKQPNIKRVGFVDGVLQSDEQFSNLAKVFPDARLEHAGADWPELGNAHYDIVIGPVDAASSISMQAALKQTKVTAPNRLTIFVLKNADVHSTKKLVVEGSTQVLAGPASESSLALCLEHALSSLGLGTLVDRNVGKTIAVLKAGGGVGATALVTQIGAMIATQAHGSGSVCVVDLDVQFGNVALYLDVSETLSLTDCVSAGSSLDETSFARALARHKSGVHVLAAPPDISPLEIITPEIADRLLSGLNRNYQLTILDMPPVWRGWSSRILERCDHIVIVTELSIPHVNLVKRQLRVLALQGLEKRPLLLICNKLNKKQTQSITREEAEHAIGRKYDFLIPEDRSVMIEAINQGVQISEVRSGTELENAISEIVQEFATAFALRKQSKAG